MLIEYNFQLLALIKLHIWNYRKTSYCKYWVGHIHAGGVDSQKCFKNSVTENQCERDKCLKLVYNALRFEEKYKSQLHVVLLDLSNWQILLFISQYLVFTTLLSSGSEQHFEFNKEYNSMLCTFVASP